MKGKLKAWKIFLVLFAVVYLFGLVVRIGGILLQQKSLAGANWLQIFLLGELDGQDKLITDRWGIRVASIVLLPLLFTVLIVNKKIRFT